MSSNYQCISRLYGKPPGGWSCDCPVTGAPISGPTFPDLLSASGKAILASGKEPPVNLSMLVQDAICRKVSWKYCRPCDRSRSVHVTFGAVVRWMKFIWDWSRNHGFSLVDQAEAERRAAICAGCPLNVSTPSGCFGCKGISWMVERMRQGQSTSRDQQLGSCAQCGCYLQVLVWMPLDGVASDATDLPDHCWKKVG